ncbi:aldehyde ferredoxin oxidoreductase C-terminal domain-containing protein [Desulfurococcus amylolyticus]|uniref:aldehyde ferredoxin oxidoreductase C-terminal domain-containing protein n=1 Tax=Desulfurococcus amylolyticus TaxID=94694 RepID=UPI00022DFA97|nr:aldehyde ferredoxin oxidoreductase C-terminal domain-containing protein [Desulfurococcus amylolyticus]
MKNLDPGELLRYTVQVKGVGVGAHGIRSGKDYPQPIAYAGSVQGGDHTSVAGLPVDSDSSEAWSVFLDSGVVCMFTAVDDSTMIKYLNTVTGWNITREEFYGEIAPRVLSLQRMLLLLGGPDATWDPRIHDDDPRDSTSHYHLGHIRELE